MADQTETLNVACDHQLDLRNWWCPATTHKRKPASFRSMLMDCILSPPPRGTGVAGGGGYFSQSCLPTSNNQGQHRQGYPPEDWEAYIGCSTVVTRTASTGRTSEAMETASDGCLIPGHPMVCWECSTPPEASWGPGEEIYLGTASTGGSLDYPRSRTASAGFPLH